MVAITEAAGIKVSHPARRSIQVKGWFRSNRPNTRVNHVPKMKKEDRPKNLKKVDDIQVPIEPNGFLEMAPGSSYWVGKEGSWPSIAMPRAKPKNSIPVATASQNQFLGEIGSTVFLVAKNKFQP